MLAHFFLDVSDLVADLPVHVLDVGQCIEGAQAHDQAEQWGSSIQHQVCVAAP
ncbi:hypothetical protein D3C79_1051910 [compost metagenome]